MKVRISLGHRPGIMGKGFAHDLNNEYIPDINDELDEYYEYLLDMQISEGDDKSPEAFSLHA